MPIVHDPKTGKFSSSGGAYTGKHAGLPTYAKKAVNAKVFGSAKEAMSKVPAGHEGAAMKRANGHVLVLSRNGMHQGYLG